MVAGFQVFKDVGAGGFGFPDFPSTDSSIAISVLAVLLLSSAY
jgi:hypothetical protein